MIKMYNHGGSLNHGCEAIVRSTRKILGKNVEIWSMNPEFDTCYGIDKVIGIKHDKPKKQTSFEKMKNRVLVKLSHSDKAYYLSEKYWFLKDLKNDDVCLSIGGDLYCYGGLEKLYFLNEAIRKKKAKTVLWGCSVEPDEIDKDKLMKKDLSEFDLIVARETLSYDALKKVNPRTYLVPDPAFQLDVTKPEKVNPDFKPNTVGINLSPLVVKFENQKGIALQSYCELFDYILNNTDMNIALIPHVVYNFDDDRKPMRELYDKYKDTGRIAFIEDGNCCELKWYVSQCRFVITARTHISIAAYSTCVPTLVMGYSVKSKGIAKDIFGTYENYVVPVQDLNDSTALREHFIWFMENEQKIKSHLESFIPDYANKSLSAKDLIDKL